MTELEKFYSSFNQDIASRQLAEEDGQTQEQAFTRVCLDMLGESNETENPVVAYDEKALGTKNQHKINGYAVSDNCDTIDLFISIYSPSSEIESLDKENLMRACTRITNFFTKSYLNKYENDVAETSDVFEFVHLLASDKKIKDNLIRVNAYILTNKRYNGDPLPSKDIAGCKIFYNVIDLNKLFSVSAQSKLPIALNLNEFGVEPSALKIPTGTEEYDAYLSYFPGQFLASLYEQYGFKLLEQNVRSFLQFRGNINRGIKETVTKRPNMFFAYNNGISATADAIEFDEEKGTICKIDNLQIVNGGQTTATLYFASKDAKDQINNVLVPVKISVIRDKDNAYGIVKSISKYANTQNKINDADLSANDPVLVEIERISRYMLTPITLDSNNQHYWFFDRISKQYDNLLSQNSKSKSKKKAFELKYPKACKFTKYELAKYYNAFCEITDGDKIIVGPHCVVDGNEVNFRAFRDYVMPDLSIDQVFYEDLIAKAILFKEVDRRHGTKRSKTPPIGDMKQLLVPYSIALLRIVTKGNLDLGKIWRNQRLSPALSDYMYNLMVELNKFMKDNSPRSNIIEWGTKEDCWRIVKEKFVMPDVKSIADDIADSNTLKQRSESHSATNPEIELAQKLLIKAIGEHLWTKIAEWGKDSGCLPLIDQNSAKNIGHRIKFGYELNRREIEKGFSIYEIVCRNNVELLNDGCINPSSIDPLDIAEAVKMLSWEKTLLILDDWQKKILQHTLSQKPCNRELRHFEIILIQTILKNHGYEPGC